jgi:hypothetical protein
MLLPYLTSGSSDINWKRISNNGQWFIHGENLTPGLYKSERDNQRTRITFTSVDYPDIRNEFIVSGDLDFSYQDRYTNDPESNSPGGEGFLMTKKDKDCLDQDFVVFEENNSHWEGPYYYYGQPSKNYNCYGITWSEDGSQLAVYDQYIGGKIHVQIFNKKAELLQQFDIRLPLLNKNEKGSVANSLYWNGTDFLFWTSDWTETHNPSRFYSFSSLHPEKINHLVDLPGDYHVIGKEPGSNRLLITSFDQDNCNTLVFNPDKKQIEKRVTIDTRCRNDERSLDNQRIAVANQKDDGDHLLIWDWGTLTFQDKGVIKRLLSWQSDLQGFLVEKQDNQQKLIFDVIRP